jgi:hypothetical protein
MSGLDSGCRSMCGSKPLTASWTVDLKILSWSLSLSKFWNKTDIVYTGDTGSIEFRSETASASPQQKHS